MAGKTATLTVKIISDARGAAKGFDDASTRAEKFRRGLDRASVAAGATLGAIGALGKAAFDSASALQQATGAVEAVFGAQAAKVNQFAEGAAQSAGLARSEYAQFASLIGAQLTNMGVAADELVPKTDALIRTGADLAAQFGGTTQDAVAALSSALKGERDPIERYGISLTQAGINAEIAALGLDTSTEAAARQAQAVATMSLIQKQGASALGAFGREADTAAGQQQRLAAEWENAKASLGEALLPVVTAAASALGGLAHWMNENSGTARVLIGTVAALAAGVLVVNGALSVFRAVTAVATAIQWAFNAAMLANPVGLIILAIVALVAAVVIAWNKFAGFRDFVKGAAAAIGSAVTSFIKHPLEFVMGVVHALGGAFQSAFSAASQAVQWVIDKVRQLIEYISNMPAVSQVIDLVSAPMTATPQLAGAAGLYGSAGPAPLYGASLSSGPAGVGPAGRAAAPIATTVVNVTVNGALDPLAVGKQITTLLRDYGVATTRQRVIGTR